MFCVYIFLYDIKVTICSIVLFYYLVNILFILVIFFFKQKTAYEMRISDWSSDVCSSDLMWHLEGGWTSVLEEELVLSRPLHDDIKDALASAVSIAIAPAKSFSNGVKDLFTTSNKFDARFGGVARSEEHTSELQSLMRISYAVFCLKKKKRKYNTQEMSS